ncbi:MAG: hypothetical protein KA072_15065 [Thermoanaerobaculaceae bacterium]|nr:hypothetical protein [Thermoanaerobaculaceae bacterium]MDI9622753.1 hypothetical protein [Acidobacteriota bacterium]
MIRAASLHHGVLFRTILMLGVYLVLATYSSGQNEKSFDPSGYWEGHHGSLAIMVANNCLYFSYDAVFGEAAHICDGVGVANLMDDDLYHYKDEQGTVAFMITAQGLRMNTINGVASFCGSGWPGDVFALETFKPTQLCQVRVPKTYFHTVNLNAPEQRKAYVIQGDQVEVVLGKYNLGDEWVLTRFQGSRTTTVGLIKKDDLACQTANR